MENDKINFLKYYFTLIFEESEMLTYIHISDSLSSRKNIWHNFSLNFKDLTFIQMANNRYINDLFQKILSNILVFITNNKLLQNDSIRDLLVIFYDLYCNLSNNAMNLINNVIDRFQIVFNEIAVSSFNLLDRLHFMYDMMGYAILDYKGYFCNIFLN